MVAASNQVTTKQSTNIATINDNENTFRVLQETLYPGSTDQEVQMILGYCKARKIDPILKPVHLVPMSVKTDKTDREGKAVYERKNVIMPGIGLYRIDASRSGQYAGVDEPEFGDEITEEFTSKSKDGKQTITRVKYPKWCKITVRKLLPSGDIALFTALEYWKENYASKSKWDDAPNDMWAKRAYGQLAKCTEAQALRKAFPDVVGNEYTKEEMEGKLYHHEDTKAVKETVIESEKVAEETHSINKDLTDISWCDSVELLQEVYTKSYKYWAQQKHKENLAKLMEAKDKRKVELEAESVTVVDPETGEVK